MKNLKRFISGALATVMVAASLMTGTFAKSHDDVKPSDRYAEQIEILSDIGVVKGTSENTFSPDEKVTREQMALLLFRLMIGKDSAGMVNTTAFTDLYDPTYSGAISWANASGYIIGTSETTFEPTRGIVLQDAMTMLVRALGHSTQSMNKGYPWTFIDSAVKLGLDDAIEDLSYTKELTRAEVAALLYNALTAEYLIPRTASNGMTVFESTTIIERVFGYEIDESVIVATNKFALEGVDTVTKTGFVTVHTEDGFITVSFEELGLEGTPEDHIGKNFRLVYKRDDKTKLVSVLGCTEIGKSAPAEVITVGQNNAHVEIGGVKYQVVETLSDTLSTNANEILVYAYGPSGTLSKVTSNARLSALLGAFDATLIYDDKGSTVADRLIIKPFSFGKYTVSGGKVNIAGNMKDSDITTVNPHKAKSGDYVLYFFNSANKTLEIAAVLPVSAAGKITRLTATTVTIGDTTYELGNEKLGVTAQSLHSVLNIGETVHAVVYGKQLLAITEAEVSVSAPSKYLIAQSETTPIFTGGSFGYVFEALIDGVKSTVFTETRTVVPGTVYRYTVDDDGAYVLIPRKVSGGVIVSGNNEFVQSNTKTEEIAFAIDSASSTTIDKLAAHYTISAGSADSMTSTGNDESQIKFTTDANTVIVVITNGTVKLHKGICKSEFTVNDGASVTAIFDNESGSVETLRFMFISDGEIGGEITTETSVKILSLNGVEYINGSVYSIYSVLDIATGKIGEMYSKSTALTIGANYLTDAEGLVSSAPASVPSGIVTGFTASTVTIGDDTYTIGEGAKFMQLSADDKISDITIFDALMGKAEFILKDGKVSSLIIIDTAKFEASHSAGVITVSALDDLGSTDIFSVVSLTKTGDTDTSISLEGATSSLVGGGSFAFTVTPASALEAGSYKIAFTVEGVAFEADFTVA